jgi:hypothetical protein
LTLKKTPEKKEGRIVAGIVPAPLLEIVEKLHDLGYSNTDIVKHGVRDLGRREKVEA